MDAMRSRLAACLLVPLAFGQPAAAGQRATSCDTAGACRQLALEAADRGDFETFHDLAWLTVRKGRQNDPELMYLLARAQSLSGRPHDALVMLRRIVALGAAPDAETHEDFRRVRALPGWTEVAALLAEVRAGEPAAAPARPPDAPRVVGTSSASKPAAIAPVTVAPAVPEPLTVARRSFAPVGLAYDAVSRRFIAGDRHANKLMVLDEEFRRVNDLAAAQSAGFFGLTAVEIDRRRGDLWVANAEADGSATALHRLQLISGRVLQVLPLPATNGPAAFGDIALTPGGTVLALDTLGKRVFPLSAGAYHRALRVVGEALLSIAALDERTAGGATPGGLVRVDLGSRTVTPVRAPRGVDLRGFVHIRAHRGGIVGVQRTADEVGIVRVRLDAGAARAISAERLADVTIADPTSMSINGDTLHYLAREADGATTVRHLKLATPR